MAEGSGAFVQVEDDNVRLDDMSQAIHDTIAYTREFADEFKQTLNSSIERLEEVVGSYEPSIDDVPNEVPTIDPPSFPVKPNWQPLVLDTDWPDGNIPEPDFTEYGILDFEYTAPTPPAEIDETFDWTASNYSSDLWLSLFSFVHDKIINGSYGLSADVHAALVDMEQEARRLNQDREFRKGVNATGAMGWNVPAGHQLSFFRQFQFEVVKRDQDALNNITVKNFDIANENMKFFATLAADLEKLSQETWNAVESRSLEAAKAAKEYIARFFAENVKLFLAKWQGIITKLEALKTKVEAISSRNNSETEIFANRARVLEAKVKAITEKNRGIVDTRKGEVEAYTAEILAVSEEYKNLLREVEVNQRAVEIEINKLLRIEELKLNAFSDKTKIAQAVAMGIANIGSQGLASSLGAINTSLSNSYSGSESRGEHYGFNAGISESHSYTEE